MEGLEELEQLTIEQYLSFSSESEYSGDDTQSKVDIEVPQGKVLLHMFTNRHLRLRDNTALYQALAHNPDKFYAVYIMEGLDSIAVAPIRWKFMIDCMEDLKYQLLEYGLEVYFLSGESSSILSTLINQWKITHLSINMDPDVNFISYNEKINKICQENNIQMFTDLESHRLLWLPNTYKDPISMTKFRALLAEAITAKQNNTCSEAYIQTVIPDLNEDQLIELGKKERIPCPFISEIPQLRNLFPNTAFSQLTFLFQGGERYINNIFLNEYREARLRHTPVEEISPIKAKAKPISPYLRFGCITPRKFFQFLVDLINNSNYSRINIDQALAGIIARDFALQASQKQPIPERIISYNNLCLPIPWDRNSNLIQSFNAAQTGFPFFDAAIIQIKTEGYAVNEVTESLATFVTNGLLWISWEEGLELFYLNSVNFDLPISTYSWLEASSSTMISGLQKQYKDPMLYVSRQIDPNGDYIKKYIPKLRDFPLEYIHKPDLAPIEVQQAANCIIGVDYPKPLFEYTSRQDKCCKRMKVFMEVVDTAAHAQALPHVVEGCKGRFPT
ncbi:photolyase related protein [Oopsacas minuta]|uniref:Cryptochrome-1 n=1 Tax=Oopsacas minuta TaxID=111878 RepID=A0AAV7JUB3_9METZ|nr:photolyase related protein [Oopsacas minuta]